MIPNVKREEKTDETGNTVYYISFKYGRGGKRPFNAYSKIEVKKEGSSYAAYVHAKIEAIYQRTEEENVHEVVTYIRRLVLEWSAAVDNFS